jgi:hypothetical protein
MIPTTLDQVQFKLKQYEAVTVAQQAIVMKQRGAWQFKATIRRRIGCGNNGSHDQIAEP